MVCPNLDQEAAKPRFRAIPLPQARFKGGIGEENVLTNPCLRRRFTLRRDESRRGEPIWEIPHRMGLNVSRKYAPVGDTVIHSYTPGGIPVHGVTSSGHTWH